MRIGFDGKKAVANLTGIGNYSRRQICSLSDKYPAAELLLFVPLAYDGNAIGQLPDTCRVVPPPRCLRWGKAAYELWRNFLQWRSIRRLEVDVFHGLSNELPFFIGKAHCRSVVTIHDLIFLRHPEMYSWLGRHILRIKTRYACRHADRIVAISECTKRDIMDVYHIKEDKISVVYQSVSPLFFIDVDDRSVDRTLTEYGVKRGYVLSVGTIERRKNHVQIIDALARMRDKDTHVIIIGKRTSYQHVLERHIKERGMSERVHIINGVPNEALLHFYHGAAMSVYTSLYEGFGLPVVESLACGCPVIAATGSCLEEAGGEHSIYVSPDDVDELARQIDGLLGDRSRRRDMSEKGRRYASRFTDGAVVKELMNVYNDITAICTYE